MVLAALGVVDMVVTSVGTGTNVVAHMISTTILIRVDGAGAEGEDDLITEETVEIGVEAEVIAPVLKEFEHGVVIVEAEAVAGVIAVAVAVAGVIAGAGAGHVAVALGEAAAPPLSDV